MRILFISDNKINGFGGGCIENKKHYTALKKICGDSDSLKVISMDDNFAESLEVPLYKNKFLDILVRLLGHSSFLYFSMLFDRKKIIDFAPDIIYLGRSRFGFFAKWAKKVLPNCKVITNVDNVEYDYVDAYFSKASGITANLKKKLEKSVVQRDEKLIIKYSDKLIFLTERNVRRYKELYGYKTEKPIIIPICLEREIVLKNVSKSKTVIFIGSLDYEPNAIAVHQLVNDIWMKSYTNRSDIQLLIAGRNPSIELEKSISKITNATLIKNFKDIKDFVPRGSLMVAPIEKGAGMKVKVAETLSMGLMITGTDEALVGYEEAIMHDKLQSVLRSNTTDEFEEVINKYLELNHSQIERIEEQNRMIFNRFYSYETSNNQIYRVIKEIMI